MSVTIDWNDPEWIRAAEGRADAALNAAGRARTGPFEAVASQGRSCLWTVPTAAGTVWIKHGYRLPPGEEVVLGTLAQRWSDRVPTLVATWSGALAMEPLPGRELAVQDGVVTWTSVARAIAELEAGEAKHLDAWLDAGVRDRRPAAWGPAVEGLLDSTVVRGVDAEVLRRFEQLVPAFVSRYIDAFAAPATLIHQDSGCCNVHVAEEGPVVLDWADVVVGHPAFSCDRLLDQPSRDQHEPIITAFLEPLGLSRAEFDGMRRSNVLHEVLRYHDELAYLPLDSPAHEHLSNAVRSQLGVLVEHEWKRRG